MHVFRPFPIDFITVNGYNEYVNKRYGAAKRQKGNEMKLFTTKKEKLAKMEALSAKKDALSKEYHETVKKVRTAISGSSKILQVHSGICRKMLITCWPTALRRRRLKSAFMRGRYRLDDNYNFE